MLHLQLNPEPQEFDIDEAKVKSYIDNVKGGQKMKTLADYLVEKGERIGLDKGERIGIEKERAEVAQRLLQERVDEAFIERVSGLSASDIEALRHSLNGS